MRDTLVGLARLKQPIAYSTLAMHLQTAHLHYRAPAFGAILREIAAEERLAGRPMLAVLVVNKRTNICGAGFFKHAAAQGYDVSEPEVFWQSEFERVCDYWSTIADEE